MKKLSFLFTALLLLASCGKGYKVTVIFPDDSNNGETAFLTNYDSGDTLATATITDSICTFEGDAGEGFFARLLVGGNRYGFIVAKNASKGEIKTAVEKIFNVTVVKINTISVTGKTHRMGRFEGKRPDYKKAFVTLKEGDKIEVVESTAK